MIFPSPLIPGRLIRRYKRFLADILFDDGEEITVHCANPGAMLGLTVQDARVYLSKSNNPNRKLAYSWELVEADFGAGPQWVGINTSHPNPLTEEAIRAGTIKELQGYARLRREVKYGVNSRIDILLESDGKPPCYVEVKNVHMMRHAPLAEFPDCVTARGTKHLEELGNMVAGGARAMMVYLIQMRAERFSLAADIDSTYAAAFARAKRRGVEAIAYMCDVNAKGIAVTKRVPMD